MALNLKSGFDNGDEEVVIITFCSFDLRFGFCSCLVGFFNCLKEGIDLCVDHFQPSKLNSHLLVIFLAEVGRFWRKDWFFCDHCSHFSPALITLQFGFLVGNRYCAFCMIIAIYSLGNLDFTCPLDFDTYHLYSPSLAFWQTAAALVSPTSHPGGFVSVLIDSSGWFISWSR